MCIRDSIRTDAQRGDGVFEKSIKALQMLNEVGYGKSDTGSVSYTHLRAHETVLDLVCRLLLEKKKNINYNTDTTSLHNNYTTTYTIPCITLDLHT